MGGASAIRTSSTSCALTFMAQPTRFSLPVRFA